jgi:hypothetical protein
MYGGASKGTAGVRDPFTIDSQGHRVPEPECP